MKKTRSTKGKSGSVNKATSVLKKLFGSSTKKSSNTKKPVLLAQLSPRAISVSTKRYSSLSSPSPTCVAQPNPTLIGAIYTTSDSLTAVKATISTKDPWLACQNEAGSTVNTFSLAFANLSADIDTSAQIGWVKRRYQQPNGKYALVRNVYIELRSSGILPYHRAVYYYDPPPLTEDWTYILEFNPTSGEFAAQVQRPDGTVPYDIPLLTEWALVFAGTKFVSGIWCGETDDIGTYLPGFSDAPCNLVNCAVAKNSSPDWTYMNYLILSEQSRPTNTNAGYNIPFFGSTNVQVWDTRAAP